MCNLIEKETEIFNRFEKEILRQLGYRKLKTFDVDDLNIKNAVQTLLKKGYIDFCLSRKRRYSAIDYYTRLPERLKKINKNDEFEITCSGKKKLEIIGGANLYEENVYVRVTYDELDMWSKFIVKITGLVIIAAILYNTL